MCGICGIVQRDRPVEAQTLVDMRETMVHRGPDGAGLHLDGRVGLGHRRLSIIDLSPAGSQPMGNEDGTLSLVFNGEIYNYLELGAKLRAAGHTLRSHTDTEVILHAYEQWGVDCLAHFVGMFAFALWDAKDQALFLARDHLGVKPLYFCWSERQFLFASELKPLLGVEPACRAPNYAALYDFLTLTRFDHDHTTCFDRIQQLRPGHYMLLELRSWCAPDQTRYWNCSPALAAERWDYAEPVEGFRSLFEESVRLQLRSDVPVGAFLSGGIDSSSIVAVASQHVREPIQTFSVAYDAPECDERVYMDAAVSAFPVIHRRVMPGAEKFAADLERFVLAQEVPTNGPGPFSEWCVAELAKGQVKVLLSGQGPDEMLGGYFQYFEAYVQTRLQELKGLAAWKDWANLLAEVRQISGLTGKPAFYYLLVAALPAREGVVRRVKRALGNRLLTTEFRTWGREVPVAPEPEPEGLTPLDRRLADTVTGWGLARLLHYADRNTMAFSLEGRVPFLDHRLVEYCMGLHYHFKIRGTTTKYVLREAMRDRLPACIAGRRDKKGFATPLAGWLRSQEPFVRDLVNGRSVARRQLLKSRAVERLLEEHMRGEKDHSWQLWRLLNLEVWFRQFVD